ncbi:MAG: PDZ domain-containing protein, partial [Bacteroidales bacterium]|nr:PDZ domain-containing protein [Bacteroidales bacterium]
REVCEKTAGVGLDEIFDVYINTTGEIDYNKYLGYAGLYIENGLMHPTGGWLGITTNENNGILAVTSVERDSPAYIAGLSARDIITEINGEKASSQKLNDVLKSLNPGEKIRITATHRNITNVFEVESGRNPLRSFEIKPLSDPDQAQKNLLNSWLIQ